MSDREFKEFASALFYEPMTGNLYWRKKMGSRAMPGEQAGRVMPAGYRQVGFKGKPYYAHRIAWLLYFGEWPEDEIDHVNQNRDDNRIANLRSVSRKINRRNSKVYSTNPGRPTGVDIHRPTGKWRARLSTVELGLFNSQWDAICARKAAENEHGYYAR